MSINLEKVSEDTKNQFATDIENKIQNGFDLLRTGRKYLRYKILNRKITSTNLCIQSRPWDQGLYCRSKYGGSLIAATY